MKIPRSLIALLAALAVIGTACGGDDADVADLADEVQIPAGEGSEPPGDGATETAAADDAEEELTEVVVDAEPGEGDRPPVDGPWPDAVMTACEAGSPTLDRIRESGTLNWAIGISPPFGFRDSSGEYAGVEIDNAAELANLLAVDSNINDYSYDLLPPTLQTNQADIIGAQLFITPPRAEVIAFSEPYFLSGQLFYVLEDSPFETIEDLNSPENRFVYGTGNAQLEIAQQLIPEAEIFDAPLRGQALLYDFMASDRADSSMTESQLMRVLLSQYTDPQLDAIGLRGRISGDLPEEEDLIEPFDVAFGLPQGDDAFKGCIDAWVGDLVDTGRMQDRIDFWLTELGS